MKFILEVDLGAGAVAGDAAAELGRILRYWAGNVKHYPLAPGHTETIYDSTYSPVGTWRIEGS
ncbi:hypothetical protein ACQCSX_03915 [Pseudarthrobacter sp. P1]|uniref:hypothetical protein n=1 Tax=Pseudarthrobacter sp. P1 TaxID=3418418 RepID=UPI003CEE17DB